MGRQNVIQTNFTSGEVSPLLRGRVDSARYANGAEEIQNFIVRPQGALRKRPGTKFIHKTRAGVRSVKITTGSPPADIVQTWQGNSFLIPFEYSDIAGYILEFGEKYIWFFQNDVPIIDDTWNGTYQQTVSAEADNGGERQITSTLTFSAAFAQSGSIAASPYSYKITTTVPHGLRDGSKIEITDHTDAAINNQVFDVKYFSPTIFYIEWTTLVASDAAITVKSCQVRTGDQVLATRNNGAELVGRYNVTLNDYNQYTLIGTDHATLTDVQEVYAHIIEIETNYLESEVKDLYTAQSADVIYIAHPDHAPRKLYRTAQATWGIEDVDFRDGPYLGLQDAAPNLNSTTPAEGTRLPQVYVEVSSYAHTGVIKVGAGGNVFADPADETKYLEYRDGDQWKLALVNTLDDTSTANVSFIDNILTHIDETDKLELKKRRVFQPGGVTASNAQRGRRTAKLDPNDNPKGLFTNTIRSNFTGTFGRADIGKYVRYGNTAEPPVYAWDIIVNIPEDRSGAEAKFAASPGALTMVSNNGKGNFVISSESITCTVKSLKAGASFALFSTNDVGRSIRLGFAGRWTWGKITAFTSTSEVTVTLEEIMPRDPADATRIAGNADDDAKDSGITFDWRLGAWSPEGDWPLAGTGMVGPGYPSVVVFHEQRLCFARTQAQPHTVWMSISADFENFSPTELDSTVLDDSGISYTLAATKVNPIKWMLSGGVLLLGSSGGEWQMKSSSTTQEPITPFNVVVTPQTSAGSISTARPQRIGQSVIHVNRSGLRVRELAYDFQFDGYQSRDLTIVAEHILRDGTQAIYSAYQQEQHSIYWAVRADGVLAAMTFNKEQEVVAWHRQKISASSTGASSAAVEGIAVIPVDGGADDSVYFLCKRTIDGSVVRYIEKLSPDNYPSSATDISDQFYVDCGVTYSGVATTTVKNLWHLEGETVNVVVDGADDGTKVVTSGKVTGVTSGTKIHVGYNAVSRVKSLPPEGGSPFGVSQGRRKRVVEMAVRVLDSVAFKYGWDQGVLSLQAKTLNSGNFLTGTVDVRPNNPHDDESQWIVESSGPVALNILSVTLALNTHE